MAEAWDGLMEPAEPVRCGDVAVFAGAWAWVERVGGWRQPVGFVGVLVDVWDGWAVFACTRQVAERVLVEHAHELDADRARLCQRGFSAAEADERVRASSSRMWFDGDEIVVDERGLYADPAALDRIVARDGLYVIGGYVWPWMAVNPAVCDRVVGSLPVR